VDCLKIADRYAQDLITDSIARNIVESVTQAGHSMKLEIIANGVADEKTIALLQKMGADYGQGDAISKLMLLEDVIAPYIGKDTLG
jgi:EAL domain-containing protein (putative c-di-GMP-specific phosphodiesterase class I)